MEFILRRIKNKRKMLGLNQKEMAEKLNTTQGNYNKLERGVTEMSVSRLYSISKVLEMSLYDLLDKTNKEKILRESNEKHIELVNKLSTELEGLRKELKVSRKINRGYYLLLKKLYSVFIHNEFRDKSENEITLFELDQKWNELKDSYILGDHKDLNRYLFDNPEGFGFGQDSIGSAIDIARSKLADYVENYLNKHPDAFGFNDDIMS